jgi:hypothetical protein
VLRAGVIAVVGLHLALLLAALPDYMVSVDSAFHVALARQYAEHGPFFWDTIHYGPAHRPNLQGPALHLAIGLLGRLLGGTGDDYVRANAILGLAQWVAAIATVVFFARRLGGDRAALLAVSALAGGAFVSGSYRVGIPSGWMFILTPWAIHFFLAGHLALAVLATALACYMHLGGFVTAPLGVAAAALLARRLRDLMVVAAGVVLLTSPYWIHFLRSLPWYVGKKGDTAWMVDPLVDLFWLVGIGAVLRAPRQNTFLAAWAAAPLPWLVQDPSRFVLQSPLVGAVLGGVAIGRWLERWRHRWARSAVTTAIVVVATVFPLGPPALGGEVLWLRTRYPRMLDWAEMRADAEALRHDQGGGLVLGYASYVPSAIAVWDDIEAEKGHWIEVRPSVDPADDIRVAEKRYVLALPPDDDILAVWATQGWLRVIGGGRWSSVLRFTARPTPAEALAAVRAAWVRDGGWIAAACERNDFGDPVRIFTDPAEIPRRAAVRGECRRRMARLQVATLLYAHAIEPSEPSVARRARAGALALGWLSSVVGDEATLDFRSAAAHARFRADVAEVARSAADGSDLEPPITGMLERYLGAARGGL